MKLFAKIASLFTSAPKVSTTFVTSAVKMVIIDFGGTGVQKSKLPGIATAITTQTQRDFAQPAPLGYGVSATIRVGASTSDIKADEWLIGLFKDADEPGALGYHTATTAGKPVIKIFPLLDEGDLSVTISHEVLEALADPEGTLAVQARDGKFWANEVCDGVEADTYLINGVKVSNFVTPAYWGGLRGPKLDFLGLCKTPIETRPGGYNQWYDQDQGWQQVENFRKAPRPYRQKVHGRAAKRREKFPVKPRK